jgi:hypothetical protein
MGCHGVPVWLGIADIGNANAVNSSMQKFAAPKIGRQLHSKIDKLQIPEP